jgi:MFS family permease
VLSAETTLVQASSPDSHRGRVFGAIGAMEGAAMVAGTVFAGTLGDVIGIVPIIAVQGAGYVLAGFLVIAWLPRTATPAVAEAGVHAA